MKLILVEKVNLIFHLTRMASPPRETMKTMGGTGFEITILLSILYARFLFKESRSHSFYKLFPVPKTMDHSLWFYISMIS